MDANPGSFDKTRKTAGALSPRPRTASGRSVILARPAARRSRVELKSVQSIFQAEKITLGTAGSPVGFL